MNIKYILGLLYITLILLGSCKNELPLENVVKINQDVVKDTIATIAPDTAIVSDYDMSDVDSENIVEFKESLVKIEKEFGEQWDFCTCIVKGDSINKAFMNPDLPDNEFDALSDRFDYIDEKCKAFRVQNPSITPEERAAHERKVKKCLKDAGL